MRRLVHIRRDFAFPSMAAVVRECAVRLKVQLYWPRSERLVSSGKILVNNPG